MKIRTDFVTNSSSVNSAVIRIDNPILLDILKGYKELGVFAVKVVDGLVFEIGSRELDEHPEEGFSPTPAFFYSDFDAAPTMIHPKTLEEVLETIIAFMEDFGDSYYFNDPGLFNKMKEELLSRKEEINRNYERVEWYGEISTFGDEKLEEGEENYWKLEYDPLNGERYVVEFYDPKTDPFLDNDET